MIYSFFLGSHEFPYRGFTFFCHAKIDEDELLGQMAKSSKNDKELLPIYRGGGKKKDKIKLSDWTVESESYFSKFFAKRSDGNDIICVPQCGPHEDMVMRTLREWCLMGNRQKALVVQNFDLSKHMKLLKEPNYENAINQPSCYLVYNFNENFILYLCRYKDDQTNKNLEELMSHCASDLLLLVNLYQDEINLSDAKIIGFVISNSETRNFKLKCELCKKFVIPFESFQSASTFHFWLEKFIRFFGISEFRLDQQDNEMFSLFCKKFISLMACTECEYLPNFTRNVTSQMEQACLLLNPKQMEILYSSFNFVILKGNFGTGKTIILQKKLEELAKKLTKKQIIYYINYDRKSNALTEVEKFIKHISPKIPNRVKILGNKDGLQLSGIFQSISKEVGQGIKSVHVFIDEYNGEDLTRSEVDLLKINLQEEHFKDSIIFIAAQPIEKVRVYKFQDLLATGKPEGNLFHELENTFHIEELTYVMRTTVQVNTIMDCLQKYLGNKQNEFTDAQSFDFTATKVTSLKSPESIQTDYSLVEEVSKSLPISRENKNEDQAQGNNETGLQQDLENNQNEFLYLRSHFSKIPYLSSASKSDGEILDTQKSSLNISPTENKLPDALDLNSKKKVEVFGFSLESYDTDLMHGKDDFDLVFKEASKLKVNHDKDINEYKTTTSYTYVSQSEIGHNIKSSYPKLILPQQSGNAFENIVSCSAVLDSLDIWRRRFVIIHFEQYPPSVLVDALKLSFGYVNFPHSCTLNVQNFLSKKNNCLVTNFRYVRGMEFENVIVIVDPEEYFLKHYLPEAIARCTNNLSLIMQQDKNMRKKEETVKDAVGSLQQQEPSVFEEWITEICNKCKEGSKYYCSEIHGHRRYLGINILSAEFREMEKYFNAILPADIEGMTVTDAEQM